MSDGSNTSTVHNIGDPNIEELLTLISLYLRENTPDLAAKLVKTGYVKFDEDGTIMLKIDANSYVDARRLSIGPLRGKLIVNEYWHLKSLNGETLSEPILYRKQQQDDQEKGLSLAVISQEKDNYVIHACFYFIDQHDNIVKLSQFNEDVQDELIDEILTSDLLDRLFYNFKINDRSYSKITQILRIIVKPSQIIEEDICDYLIEYYNDFAKDTWMQDDTNLTLLVNDPKKETHTLRMRFGLKIANVHEAEYGSTSLLS